MAVVSCVGSVAVVSCVVVSCVGSVAVVSCVGSVAAVSCVESVVGASAKIKQNTLYSVHTNTLYTRCVYTCISGTSVHSELLVRSSTKMY